VSDPVDSVVVTAEFGEEATATRVASVPLSHLSIELGHLYMEDFAARGDWLKDVFEQVAPWAQAATQACTADVPGRPRVSTCFLIDDYFTQLRSPAEVLPALLDQAEQAGLRIDYVAREAACAQTATGVRPAELVRARLVADPPPGTTGGRPPVQESGWLCNGVRSPKREGDEAMRAVPDWRPPSENGANRHSIFLDVELWSDQPDGPLWSCPFLSAVWQLLRLGLLREGGRPLWTPQLWTEPYPQRWDELPPLIQVRPDAASFAAYRTYSVLGTRFLPIEHAVRTILGQFMASPAVFGQVADRAAAEGLALPDELVDRVGYAFVGGWR
jgi:hypothetical protein